MRRKDREVTDQNRIGEILKRCEICRVGFCDQGEVYIVPLNFGLDERDGRWIFYFHGAKEGRKMALVAQNPRVGLELETGYRVRGGEVACEWTASFESVIGNGVASVVTDREEKIHGLRRIMAQVSGKVHWDFAEKMLEAVCVWKIEVDCLSCKVHE